MYLNTEQLTEKPLVGITTDFGYKISLEGVVNLVPGATVEFSVMIRRLILSRVQKKSDLSVNAT